MMYVDLTGFQNLSGMILLNQIKLAIVTILTISSEEQPLDKSITGFASPCTIGPVAIAPPILSATLYAILPEFRSGKMKTFASPFIIPPGFFRFATSGIKAVSN